jgi:hypothetical protein
MTRPACRWLRCHLTLLCLLILATPAWSKPGVEIAIGFYLPVIREVPRRDVEVSLRFWIDEVAKSIGVTYKPIEFFDDLDKLHQAVASGRINFIVATSMGVVQRFDPSELADGFSGYKATPDHLMLVVRRDAGIRGPADLVGKRLALLGGDELSRVHLESLMLRHWGKAGWARLGKIAYEERSSKLVHRLFFGQADAALVLRNAYETAVALNPQVARRLLVLDDYTVRIRSPHIGLFSAKVSPEDREEYTRGVIKLNESPRGRQVLHIYQADVMVRTPLADLAPFQELLAAYRSLRSAPHPSAGKKVAR